MAEKHIISQFMPGMNIDLVPTEREPGASDFMINMESLPGRGLAIRQPFVGYIQPDGVGGFVTTGGSKVHSWCMFDGALWFVVEHANATTQDINTKVYRVLAGDVVCASTAPLVMQDASLKRDFSVPWKMTSTGDSIVFTSGVAFYDGNEENLAPFYIMRDVSESGSTYRAFSASITDRLNYGAGIAVSIVPYIETGLYPDCYKDGYGTYWDEAVPFSATLQKDSWVRILLTAVVGDSETILYDKTLDLKLTDDIQQETRFGSCRAIRIVMNHDAIIPVDTSRIRYYRSIGNIVDGLPAPQLLAEMLPPGKRTTEEIGHSLLGSGMLYSYTSANTHHALSGGVNLFYTCDPYDYAGLAMSRGWVDPFSLWPSAALDQKWDDWPTSGTGIKEMVGSEDIGTYPLSGLCPIVAWWKNDDKADFTDPQGIATLGRYQGFWTDPRWRGMMKPVYDAGDSYTQHIYHIGSKTQQGALLWTGQPCFLVATIQGGKIDVGDVGGIERKTWSPRWLYDAVNSTSRAVPDFAGLDEVGTAIYGISHGDQSTRWPADRREIPFARRQQLNYFWPSALAESISSSDCGALSTYFNDALVVYPWNYGEAVSGYGRFAKAMLSYDSLTKDRPLYGCSRFGLSWIGSEDFSVGPVGHLGMAIPMIPDPTRNKTGDRFVYLVPKQGMPQAISYRYRPAGVNWQGFWPVNLQGQDNGHGCYQRFVGYVSYRLMHPNENNSDGSRCRCNAIVASRQGNDLYVTLGFWGATGNGASGWTPPVYSDIAVSLEGPWYSGRPNDDITWTVINPITVTYSINVPRVTISILIFNVFSDDPALLATGQGNRLRVEMPYELNPPSNGSGLWGALFEPWFDTEVGNDSGEGSMPYVWIWKGIDKPGSIPTPDLPDSDQHGVDD